METIFYLFVFICYYIFCIFFMLSMLSCNDLDTKIKIIYSILLTIISPIAVPVILGIIYGKQIYYID